MELQELKRQVLNGKLIGKEEALWLAEAPLEELCRAADEIRKAFCGNGFDICTIINGKSGRCSEDCKYCAQSAFYHTGAGEYPLLGTEELTAQARYNDERGVLRYSIVTSGKRLSDQEVDRMCESIRDIKEETGISVCVSFGLLNEDQYRRLKEAGAERVHNNPEIISPRSVPPILMTINWRLSGRQKRRDSVCAAEESWGWGRRWRTASTWRLQSENRESVPFR